MELTYKKAREFIYRNARPIDLARWQYHFEDGKKEEVLKALAYYQNEDGGFGHALEADSWNLHSTPIQTWTATEILREIGFTDREHPVMQGILKYLDSGACFDGHFWYASIVSNNDYPHAPWWHTEESSIWGYNPTACLAGFVIRFADRESELYEKGCQIAKEAFESLRQEHRVEGETLCYIRLLQYCREANVTNLIDLDWLEEKLREAVKNNICPRKEDWEFKYVCRPSQYVEGKECIFYEDNKELADYECEFIANTQLEDGSWNLNWQWKDYPEEWTIARNWWKADRAIHNLLYLRGMGV